MRYALIVLAFIVSSICEARQLPSFPSDQIEKIDLDSTLEGSPARIELSFRNYEKAKSKLVDDDLVLKITLIGGKYQQIEFFNQGKKFLTHQYDQYGRIIDQERVNGVIPFTKYTYDEETKTSTEANFRASGQVHSKVIINYNEDFNPIMKAEYKGETQLIHYWTFTYDSFGEVTRKSYFDKEGQSIEQIDYINSYSGDSVQERSIEEFKNQSLVQRTELKSNADSVTRKTIMYEQNGFPRELNYSLEKDSLRVSINGFYEQGDSSKLRSRFREIYIYEDLIEYEARTISGTKVKRYATFYKYDSNDNWIKKITYENGIAIREEIRKIVY